MDAAPGHGLIGRTRELERLSSALRRAIDGRSSTVLVVGEAGIGKTALVEAFVADTGQAGGRVLTGSCLPLETGGLPYAPFVAMFRALLEDVDPGALPALLGPDRAELARLIPEVRGRPSHATAPDVGPSRTGKVRPTIDTPRSGSSSWRSAWFAGWPASPRSSS